LNCLDFNCTSERLAVAGNDAKVRIFDDTSAEKDLLMTLKATGKLLPGHSNRIYALKFSNTDENILYSAGWDDTV
jgi:WD40 repeat protein